MIHSNHSVQACKFIGECCKEIEEHKDIEYHFKDRDVKAQARAEAKKHKGALARAEHGAALSVPSPLPLEGLGAAVIAARRDLRSAGL